MPFCTNCGQSMAEETQVCQKCGAPSRLPRQAPVPGGRPGGKPESSVLAGAPAQAAENMAPGQPGPAPPQYPASGIPGGPPAPPLGGMPGMAPPGYPPQPGMPYYAPQPGPLYPVLPEPPRKKTKVWLVVLLVILGTALLIGFGFFLTSVTRKSLEKVVPSLTTQETFHGLRYQMPERLVLERIDENSVLYSGSIERVEILYATYPNDTVDDLIDETLAFYNEEGEFVVTGGPETVRLSGEEWTRVKGSFTFEEAGDASSYYVESYFFASDSEQYMIEFVGFGFINSLTVDTVLESLEMELNPDPALHRPEMEPGAGDAGTFDEQAAAAHLTGTWDAGDGGYLIFGEDGSMQWYSDSSLDGNNMFLADWEISYPLIDLVSMEANGYVLTLTYHSVVIEGVAAETIEQPVREYEMIPQSETVFRMEDGANNLHYMLEKVA